MNSKKLLHILINNVIFLIYVLHFLLYCDMIIAVERFPDSSMVEHTAVNRGVVGSSPTRGANN